MTKDLTRTKTSEELSFQERVQRALQGKIAPQVGAVPRTSALLLDVSGSMEEELSPNQRRIDGLRELAKDFQDIRRWEFSWDAKEIPPGGQISEPYGGTNMALAFQRLREKGISHVVMLTDGRPDDPSRSLDAARGLKIDVFYVGPDPCPQFLHDLARATGGQFGKMTLLARKELTSAIRGLLPQGKDEKGPIAL